MNDSNSYVSNIEVAGGDVFGFDSDGLCTESFSGDVYCAPAQQSGDDTSPSGSPGYDYQGPNNTFYVSPTGGDYAIFNAPLAPGGVGTTYFSLEEAPTTVGPAGLDTVTASTSIAGTEGTSTGSVEVATFSDGVNALPASDFTATTNWGDSSDTSGVITQPGGEGNPYVVSDSHTYLSYGTFTTSVSVEQNASPYGSANGSASIADAGLSALANPTIPDATTKVSFTAPVAAFADANVLATAGEYSASINWGDGTSPTSGSVTSTGTTSSASDWEVSGTHFYKANGTYEVMVTVTDTDGSPTSSGSTVVIDNTVTDYDAVINCGSTCSGLLRTPSSRPPRVRLRRRARSSWI